MTAIRLLVGLTFLGTGAFKVVFAGRPVADFERWGIPAPELAVPAVGAFELAGGVLLLLGVRPRLVAALLAAEMTAAVLTAGRIDGGGLHLLAPLGLAALCVLLVSRGRGRTGAGRTAPGRPRARRR